jgi:hypothetical protein
MTLVKLHACQYRKVKSFPDIGENFEGEGVLLGLRAAPPVHRWRLQVGLSLRSQGRIVGDAALGLRPISFLRLGPIRLRRDRLPSR